MRPHMDICPFERKKKDLNTDRRDFECEKGHRSPVLQLGGYRLHEASVFSSDCGRQQFTGCCEYHIVVWSETTKQ